MLIVDKENNNPVKVKHHQKTLYGILDPHAVYSVKNAVIEKIDEPCDMQMANLKNIFSRQNIQTHDKKLLTGAVPFFIHMSDVEMITKEKRFLIRIMFRTSSVARKQRIFDGIKTL